MDLFHLCPHLIPLNSERTLYRGYITTTHDKFEVMLELKSRDEIKSASLSCDWKLNQLLKECIPLLQKRMEQCAGVYAFMVELKALVERQIPSSNSGPTHQLSSYYSCLVDQLQALGWDRLLYIDAELKVIHLLCEDAVQRKHTICLKLHSQHPQVAPECKVDLPEKFELSWTSGTTLANVCKQVEKVLGNYQDLWSVLDEIDQTTWVLEPEAPSRAALYRRIALGNNASIQITLDVKCPRILPECRFLGADHVINPIRDNLNKNLDQWDMTAGLVHNLQTVLDIDLPSPHTTTKNDLSLECGICYTYRLDGNIPDQVCDDSRCGQPYHQVCLYEWLRAVPTNRQSFNVIFGECPYCNKSVTVKMPT